MSMVEIQRSERLLEAVKSAQRNTKYAHITCSFEANQRLISYSNIKTRQQIRKNKNSVCI